MIRDKEYLFYLWTIVAWTNSFLLVQHYTSSLFPHFYYFYMYIIQVLSFPLQCRF